MTKLEILKQTFWGSVKDEFPARTLRVGEIVDIPDEVAARWITRKIACVPVAQIPKPADAEAVDPPGRGFRVPGVRALINKSDAEE